MKPASYKNISLLFLAIFISCVEPFNYSSPPAEFLTVVEGMISTEPGPYTVKISRSLSLEADTADRVPFEGVNVTLFDDEGNRESFTEVEPGEYQTSGLIRGKTGHEYFIRLETPEGRVFESIPDMIHPVGKIEQVYYEFEERTVLQDEFELTRDVFNVFVDSRSNEQNSRMRWRYTGTYEVLTYPELRMTEVPPYTPYKNPVPCSGYIVIEHVPGGKLFQVGPCTCCECWVNEYESYPQLSDDQFIEEGAFNRIKVGEVPVNSFTFYQKFMVTVEQMSLSEQAFSFFKLIRDQKVNASNIFQPPSGEIRGNIRAGNSNDAVVGMFWATDIDKQRVFIYPDEIPYPLTPPRVITEACYDAFQNATTEIPEGWEE